MAWPWARIRRRKAAKNQLGAHNDAKERSDSMGLFDSLRLTYGAGRLAQNFTRIRRDHLSHIASEILHRFPIALAQREVSSDSAPDLYLRGLQLWSFTCLLAVHRYVDDARSQEFAGHLVNAIAGGFEPTVINNYLKTIHAQRKNFALLVAEVAACISKFLQIEDDPRPMTFVALLLPFLVIDTQASIAEHFGDSATAGALRIRAEALLAGINGGGVPVPMECALICPSCALGHMSGPRVCTLCGVPLRGRDCEPAVEEGMSDISNAEGTSKHGAAEAVFAPPETPPTARTLVISAEMIERGKYFRENRFKGIRNWEERMYSEFGEKVVPHFKEIWNRTT